MLINVQSTPRRVLAAAVCVILLGVFAYHAQRLYRAAAWSHALDEAGLDRAVRLDPTSAEYHNLLARYTELAGEGSDAAMPHYREATELNPRVARYWLDLARAAEVARLPHEQEDALQHALAVDPNTPDVAWEAAMFYLVRGETSLALPRLRTVILNDPSMTASVLEISWRATGDPGKVLADVMPPDANAAMEFVNLLVRREQPDAAMIVWKYLVKLQQPLAREKVFPYVNYLLDSGRGADAAEVWQDMAALTGGRAYLPSENRIVNPGFEEEILDAGFDWRVPQNHGASFALDSSEFHGGNRSMRISFSGEPFFNTGLMEYVAVTPSTRYAFRGFLKADEVFSNSGPRFVVSNPATHEVVAMGDDVIGSSLWHETKLTFTTGPATRVLVVSIGRNPGESRIRGTIWIDDLSLREQ